MSGFSLAMLLEPIVMAANAATKIAPIAVVYREMVGTLT